MSIKKSRTDVVKTIREKKIGKVTLRLVDAGKAYAGIVLQEGKISSHVEGADPEDVWQKLEASAARSSPNYFGFEAAKNRFLSFFPDGFASEHYLSKERQYKLQAKELLDNTVPLDAALNSSGHGEAIRAVFNKTNLISPFEKMRLNDALLSDQADQFINGAARMASGEIKNGLREMEKSLKPHDVAKWTVVTYLPFLWNPTKHMFLKPTITKDFSERIGHPFFNNYEAKLDIGVYESLLDLVDKTEQKISGLGPQDRIDTQSFIWIVGAYDMEVDVSEVHA
ncbi:MAG: hypothetical protein COA65_00630 [Rhodospirillaceae bacterium]|nr:MAG: hypothetical protein COA65_00630 [Rhodospirillaceae bacterium]